MYSEGGDHFSSAGLEKTASERRSHFLLKHNHCNKQAWKPIDDEIRGENDEIIDSDWLIEFANL